MKQQISILIMALAAFAAQAQHAHDPYADDVLRAEAQEHNAHNTHCGDVVLSGQKMLTGKEAQALLCMAISQLPLALDVWEHGGADRAEIITGALLQTGVSPDALGRIASFYDAGQAGGKDLFTLEDPHHGDMFYTAWLLVFGHDFDRKIYLNKENKELVLDVDGVIRWEQGHHAVTLWVRDTPQDEPQLRVLDPVLSPDKLLSPEEWRKLHNAEQAALVWGALGEVPTLMVEYLPPKAALRLKRHMNIATNDPLDAKVINRLLRESSPEVRAEIMAYTLDIPEKSPHHPHHWTAYSFSGELKRASGHPLPAWQTGSGTVQHRIEAALDNLELVLAYHTLRARYVNDEEFLQDIKRHMLAKNKKPKQVTIDFDALNMVD